MLKSRQRMIIPYLFFGYKSEHALIEPAEKLRERKREDQKAPMSNAKPKQKIKLKKLKRTQKVPNGGLKNTGYNCRIVCNPDKVFGISKFQRKNHVYICGKCFIEIFIYSTFTYQM